MLCVVGRNTEVEGALLARGVVWRWLAGRVCAGWPPGLARRRVSVLAEMSGGDSAGVGRGTQAHAVAVAIVAAPRGMGVVAPSVASPTAGVAFTLKLGASIEPIVDASADHMFKRIAFLFIVNCVNVFIG